MFSRISFCTSESRQSSSETIGTSTFCLEDSAETASLFGGSPSSHGAHGSSSILLAGSGHCNGVNVLAGDSGQVSTPTQLEDADVVGEGPAIVVLVEDHFGDSNVSLVFIVIIQILTSNMDSKTGGRLSITAVSSSDDPVSSHEGLSTHEGATNSSPEEGDLPVEGVLPSHDLSFSPGEGSGDGLKGDQGRPTALQEPS